MPATPEPATLSGIYLFRGLTPDDLEAARVLAAREDLSCRGERHYRRLARRGHLRHPLRQ